MAVDQTVLLTDDARSGAAWCATHAALVDRWLAGLFADAGGPDAGGIALVAVGGYGRAELCPQSDIDVVLVHDGRRGGTDLAALAGRLWPPIADRGLRLTHRVRTLRGALEEATGSLDTAIALLSARHVAGDEQVAADLAGAARHAWRAGSQGYLAALGTRVDLRHQAAGEVAFRIEPDVKEGRGGLLDVRSLEWADLGEPSLIEPDRERLDLAAAVLLDVRVELQRLTGQRGNVLALHDQAAVARALGLVGEDDLMHRVATAARTIAWTSDDTWRRLRGSRHRTGQPVDAPQDLGGGVGMRHGEIGILPSADTADPTLALRIAVAAAERRAPVDRGALERLASSGARMADPWPAHARRLLVDLLRHGTSAIPAMEALDQRGIWERILPEWVAVRARPQRNPHHRFTVDRHLLETVGHAARGSSQVERPDLLVLAALLHDLGRGCAGDHCVVGADVAGGVAARMGFPPGDAATVAWLVRHHLLLGDVAGRRDLDDSTTIERVAAVVGSPDRLALLAALTEADAQATGPAGWSPTRARLVGRLVERVGHVLAGRATDSVVTARFPTPAQMDRLAGPGRSITAEGDRLTVVAADRPGTFSRVAGVLALHGLDVVSAAAHSDAGRALAEFLVAEPGRREHPWALVVADVESALDGRLAIASRLAEQARAAARSRRAVTPRTAISVTFDDGASTDATVVDVQAPDGNGVLYRITRVFGDLDIDIRSARVQTMGSHVVDGFYLRDRRGRPITEPDFRAEIVRAIVHSLSG